MQYAITVMCNMEDAIMSHTHTMNMQLTSENNSIKVNRKQRCMTQQEIVTSISKIKQREPIAS